MISLLMVFGMFAVQTTAVFAAGNATSVATKDEFVKAVGDNSITNINITADMNLTGLNEIDVSNRTIDLGGHKITADNFTFVFCGSNVTIKNGTFDANGGSYAMFIGGDKYTTSNVVVQDIKGIGGINVYNASATIRNVDFTGTKYYSVWCDENAQVKIESGNFQTNGVAVLGVVDGNVNSSLEIVGGTFNCGTKPLVLEDKEFRQPPVISGGYFTKDPSSYVASGYRAEQGAWPVGNSTYAYAVNVVPKVVNKVESVSVAAYDAKNDVDTTNPVSAVLSESTIILTGKVPSADKKVTVSYTATDGTTGTAADVPLNGSGTAFTQPADFKVGETTYTFNIAGLSVLPAEVATVVAAPKAETALPANTSPEKTNAADQVATAITKNASLADTVGLSAAVSEKVDTTEQGGTTTAAIETKDPTTGKVEAVTATSQTTKDALTSNEIKGADDSNNKVVMVAQPYLDIKVADVGLNANNEMTEITLNIEPKYNVVAVVVGKTETVTANTKIDTAKNTGNAAVVAKEQTMTVTTPVTISVPLPANLTIADENNFYVKHVHTNTDGSTSTYYYKAEVTTENGVRVATFTTTHGFSDFTFLYNGWSTTINFEGVATGYTLTGVNTEFPTVSKSGYKFIGWSIDGSEETYTALSEELLKNLNGKNVDATPQYVKNTYDLSVADVSFDAIVYGDAQPDEKAITVTSSGNSDATISSVTVNDKSFVISGSGTTVESGKSISTWAVRPADGLAAGTYKSTMTVTYDDNATAEATVSLTVKPAAQAAPAAPTKYSATSASITVDKLDANTNGSAVEYRINNESWQSSNEFTGLNASTEYLVEVRYAASSNYEASPASSAMIKTLAASDVNTTSSSTSTMRSADTGDNTGILGWSLLLDLSIVIAAYTWYSLKRKINA